MASALPDLLVQAGIFCLLFLPHRHKYSRSRRLLSGALYIYFCIVLDLTLLPVLCRDITDLITNVAGCACGYLIGLPLAQPLQRLGERLDRTENNRRR